MACKPVALCASRVQIPSPAFKFKEDFEAILAKRVQLLVISRLAYNGAKLKQGFY